MTDERGIVNYGYVDMQGIGLSVDRSMTAALLHGLGLIARDQLQSSRRVSRLNVKRIVFSLFRPR